LASPTGATIAVAVIGPTPPTTAILLHNAARFMNDLIHASALDPIFQHLDLLGELHDHRLADAGDFAFASGQHLRHRLLECFGRLSHRHAPFWT
jgi:hypothetical protein